MRRLEAAKPHVGQLIRGLASEDADRHRIDTSQAQVTVVDIHRLHDRAQRFVVGVMLKGEFERKEASGSPRPLMLVVLDVVPTNVVYRREVGTAPPIPPCGRRAL